MKENYTDIIILLDRSGSMNTIKHTTLDGLNQFLADQKNANQGEVKDPVTGRNIVLDLDDDCSDNKPVCKVTLVQFSTGPVVNSFTAKDIEEIQPLTNNDYIIEGGTALIDSFCDLIDQTGQRLAAMEEKDRPGRVIFVAITDGQELNSSRFDRADLNQRITHQQEVYNWQFIYLGANQDAISEAQSYGISSHNSMTYATTDMGMERGYTSLSSNVLRKRSAEVQFMSCAATGFTQDDYNAQQDQLDGGLTSAMTNVAATLKAGSPKARSNKKTT